MSSSAGPRRVSCGSRDGALTGQRPARPAGARRSALVAGVPPLWSPSTVG